MEPRHEPVDPRICVECHARMASFAAPVDTTLRTLEGLDADGVIDGLTVDAWRGEVRLGDESSDNDTAARFEEFAAWADQWDVSIRPPFSVETRHSELTGDTRKVLVTPVPFLAVYVDGALPIIFWSRYRLVTPAFLAAGWFVWGVYGFWTRSGLPLSAFFDIRWTALRPPGHRCHGLPVGLHGLPVIGGRRKRRVDAMRAPLSTVALMCTYLALVVGWGGLAPIFVDVVIAELVGGVIAGGVKPFTCGRDSGQANVNSH